MKKIILSLVGLFVFIAAGIYWYVSRFDFDRDPPVVEPDTLRETLSGSVVGFRDRGVDVWLGIPFARPPEGDLRWRAPRPPVPWSDAKEVLDYGPECPQNLMGLSGQEDCLYLNVWSPSENSDSLPVMFFIHGGGNHLGSANAGGLYDGQRFASNHDVVMVSINYRLGPLGWFSHPSLAVEETDEFSKKDNSGNYGTLDILAALEWVQGNIKNFGGDPDNVTIFGESAGAFNVLSMMVSPLAEGLYHKAISQSGGIRLIPMNVAQHYHEEGSGHPLSAREITSRMLLKSGLAVDQEDARGVQEMMSNGDIRKFLLNQPAESILLAQDDSELNVNDSDNETTSPEPFVLWSAAGRLSPTLLGDGYVLPKGVQIRELLSDPARFNAGPVILGSNRDEAKLFMMMDPHFTRRVWGVPVLTKNEDDYARATDYGSLMWKADSVDELAIVLSQTQEEEVFAYRFDWDDLNSLLTLDLHNLLGAAHALELPFVFGNLDLLETALLLDDDQAARELSDRMMSYWAEFAYSGTPARGKDGSLAEWSAWTNEPGTKKLMLLDSGAGMGNRMVSTSLTYEDIAEQLASDERFDPEAKCKLARRMFEPELSNGLCIDN